MDAEVFSTIIDVLNTFYLRLVLCKLITLNYAKRLGAMCECIYIIVSFKNLF